MMNDKQHPSPLKWRKIETGWFESLDGHYVMLDDEDIGWTLMLQDEQPPEFIGCFPTLPQALGCAQSLTKLPKPVNN